MINASRMTRAENQGRQPPSWTILSVCVPVRRGKGWHPQWCGECKGWESQWGVGSKGWESQWGGVHI